MAEAPTPKPAEVVQPKAEAPRPAASAEGGMSYIAPGLRNALRQEQPSQVMQEMAGGKFSSAGETPNGKGQTPDASDMQAAIASEEAAIARAKAKLNPDIGASVPASEGGASKTPDATSATAKAPEANPMNGFGLGTPSTESLSPKPVESPAAQPEPAPAASATENPVGSGAKATEASSATEQAQENASPQDQMPPEAPTTPPQAETTTPASENKTKTETESKGDPKVEAALKMHSVFKKLEAINKNFDANSDIGKALAKDIMENPDSADKVVSMLDTADAKSKEVAAQLAAQGINIDAGSLAAAMLGNMTEQYIAQIDAEDTKDAKDPTKAEDVKKRGILKKILKALGIAVLGVTAAAAIATVGVPVGAMVMASGTASGKK